MVPSGPERRTNVLPEHEKIVFLAYLAVPDAMFSGACQRSSLTSSTGVNTPHLQTEALNGTGATELCWHLRFACARGKEVRKLHWIFAAKEKKVLKIYLIRCQRICERDSSLCNCNTALYTRTFLSRGLRLRDRMQDPTMPDRYTPIGLLPRPSSTECIKAKRYC